MITITIYKIALIICFYLKKRKEKERYHVSKTKFLTQKKKLK